MNATIITNTSRIEISGSTYLFEVSSVLFTPVYSTKSGNNLQGLVIYHHPSVFGIQSIPSKLTAETLAVASIYIFSNFAIYMNDYAGFSVLDGFPNPTSSILKPQSAPHFTY